MTLAYEEANLKLNGQAFEAEVWWRFCSSILIKLLFLINLWYDFKAVTLAKALNPWVRCALGRWLPCLDCRNREIQIEIEKSM